MTKYSRIIIAAVALFGLASVVAVPSWSQAPAPKSTPKTDSSKQVPPKVKTGARKTGEATQTGARNTGGGITRLTRKAGDKGPDQSKKLPPKVKTAARKTGDAVKTGARNIGGGIKRIVRKSDKH